MKEFFLIFTLILFPIIKQNNSISLNNVPILFIGDSHTANHSWGWQILLKNKTKLELHNTSVVGRHVSTMLKTSKKTISPYFKYCFIYGGVNDIYSKRNPHLVYKDVQSIVNICNLNNVKPVIIIGLNVNECIKTTDKQEYFKKNYIKYQQLLKDSIVGAKIISINNINRNDCFDWICHMKYSGHKKLSDIVIKEMNFKSY